MTQFTLFVFTPAGLGDAALAIAASRAGAVGVYDAQLDADPRDSAAALAQLARHARGAWGVRIGAVDDAVAALLRGHAGDGLQWVVADAPWMAAQGVLCADLRAAGVRVLAEVTHAAPLPAELMARIDGVVVKGNESGGFVGEDASFILLQKWLQRAGGVPLYLRGGMTPHVAAACHAVGVAGGVLDSQLLLLDEVRIPATLRTLLGNLAGSETVGVGNGETGDYFRLLVRPNLTAARQFAADCDGVEGADLRQRVAGRIGWQQPTQGLLPIGQDVAFATVWRKRHGTLGAVLAAFDQALQGRAARAIAQLPVREGAPLAQSLGIRFPIVQGPMTRVSDSAEFALAVAAGGALPMLAFATLKGDALQTLLERSAALLAGRPWGIGLLGFAPQELLDEQLAAASRFKPAYAIIAGGRPDQAVHLERGGVPTFLHVPAAGLISTFLQDGARRFIFEGRECGGHIGPLSSFVLWSSMVDKLLTETGPGKVAAASVQVLFAGGIHDALSSAMLQVLAAPLVEAGVQVGVLMGSAYLFTDEIVASGAIVRQFQQEVLDCEHTVNLESGPGHASRCGYTPFAADFFRQRKQLKADGVAPDESRRVLDDLILGRLRTASKGRKREGLNGRLEDLTPDQQRAEGMYMLGQVATLRAAVTSIDALHDDVCTGAEALLLARAVQASAAEQPVPTRGADIAIIGIATVLPKSADVREYWENIVARVDAITEIPSHRWDWRLYFDADRTAPDKVYSKWGGFLDDLAFDPTRYGMPPKSIESVDPMQLMGLEVARRTLADAGYADRPFDRERAAVILGASGGAGDFGMQYGLRSELPRFSGALPAEVADRLPTWTEDSFAGILPNVAAGRIANRLNFGGMNLTVDAACASSLAAVYQGVNELVAGRSDLVIAGGIDTVQGPFGYLCFSKTQALSPRGRCSTFDAGGDGIVISEGLAMIALKRLADAERDGDRIYAVIKGVGSSSDGNARGLTAPLPAGQLRAMRRAYGMAGFGPATVGLFEAHGTGTVAGDTAELESTTRLMQEEGAPARHAVIGSVKTNIGHTKATAGVAGLVKAALALHRRVLPPHRNVTTPNAVLADPAAPLYLVDEATPWVDRGDVPRRAACSAFGFGGTNFHVVMEEHAGEYRDWLRPSASDARSAELLLWSDADRGALLARVEALATSDALDTVLLRDLAASLAARWQAPRPNDQRLAIVARDGADLRLKLAAAASLLKGEAKPLPPGVFHGAPAAAPAGKVAVLFPGQGSQYPGMAREAALHFGVVAAAFDAADAALRGDFEARFGAATRLSQFILPRGAYDSQAKAAAKARLTSTDVAQPALGVVEAGLYRLLQSLGLKAEMLGGHSYGEFVALHAAGAFDFAALMQLSAARGRYIVDAASADGAELGTMAAVAAPRRVVEDAIADIDDVIIANHNAPQQSIISGTNAGVAAATEKLLQAGVEVVAIPVAAAFHSSLVKPAQQALSDRIEATAWAPLQTPVYSNSTARPHAADVTRVKRQMAEHLVHPVEFVGQIEAMYKDGARVFVEVGPKSVLTRLVGRILEPHPHLAVAIDDGTGLPGLLGGIAQLLCAGIELDAAPLFAGRDCRIGDPANPASLLRVEPVPKHAWMLNGSGARRAADPVRQIGVTLEQLQAAPAQPVVQPPVQPRPQPAPAAAAAAVPVSMPVAVLAPQRPGPTSVPLFKRSRSMDERRTTSTDPSVMSEYFTTMRQFLETQERVMSSFLGEPAAARPMMRPRPMATLPRVADVAPTLPAPVVAVAPIVVPAPAAPVAAASAPVAVAAAAPVVAVAAVAVAAPAPAPAVAKPAAVAVAKPADGALGREQLLDMLLGIVEEKTGYPRYMVGLDQNLEADLGIDSIKRIEVVGAMLQQLPAGHRDALTDSRSKLNTQQTLGGMLDLIVQAKVGGAVAVPFDSAGVGSPVGGVAVSHPPRLVMQALQQPLTAQMPRRLAPGRFVLTRDRAGVADALAALLAARKVDVTIVETADLASEDALLARCKALAAATCSGVVHLAALGTPTLTGQETAADWRQAIQLHDKSLFLLLRELDAALGDGAHVIAASDLGGLFGRDGTADGSLRLVSGSVGMLKSLLEEKPALRVKAIDLDPRRSADLLAADLLAEIELDGGRQEVGYPQGQRTVFATVGADVAVDPARDAALRDVTVLATGGARGITAEVLRELARPGNTLVLTGRSALVEAESPDTAVAADANALRQVFVARVRAGSAQMTPAQIQRSVQAVLDQREMRANIADFRAAGATVAYHAVDVTDEAALHAVVRQYPRIDGVVHGAGVIEDKRLADKAGDSWSRVVDTKVIGALVLQKVVDAAHLKFFTVFSSVAGRYGNSGQSDYATANETMNRLCIALQSRWGDRVAVSALCWGPWGATTHGAGMVTAATEAKFAEKGVRLVSAALGRRLFRQEIARAAGTPVEVVCGEAPWDSREEERGAFAQPADLGPLLGGTTAVSRPTGERILPIRLDPARHLYLQEHALDGKMVLPAAAALEIMAESVRALWPNWRVVAVHDHKLLKGIEVGSAGRDLQVFMSPPPYGSSEGFEVSAALQSDLGQGRALTHYRCTVRLEQALPQPLPVERRQHHDKSLSTAKAYGEWLFHGPRFQVIDAIDGLSQAGSGARVRSSTPAQWLAGSTAEGGWLFDPALLDAAAQMAWLWSRAYRDESALPTRFGRVVRYRDVLPQNLMMEYERIHTADPTLIRGNVTFVDEHGEAVLAVEELDSVASPALNRLGGTARAAETAA